MLPNVSVYLSLEVERIWREQKEIIMNCNDMALFRLFNKIPLVAQLCVSTSTFKNTGKKYCESETIKFILAYDIVGGIAVDSYTANCDVEVFK